MDGPCRKPVRQSDSSGALSTTDETNLKSCKIILSLSLSVSPIKIIIIIRFRRFEVPQVPSQVPGPRSFPLRVQREKRKMIFNLASIDDYY